MLAHDRQCTFAPPAAHVRLPACPQCGDMLLAPLLAEHVNSSHVRNHWACESCGHTFRRSFKFAAAEIDVLTP